MALQTQALLNEKDFFMPNITPHIFQVEEFFLHWLLLYEFVSKLSRFESPPTASMT